MKAPIEVILHRAAVWDRKAKRLETLANNLKKRARSLRACVEALQKASEGEL